MEFFWFLVIGGVSGWLAGLVWKGGGFGLLGNIVIGIIGGLVGGWIAGHLGLYGHGIIYKIVISAAGAWLILFVVSLFRKK